MRILVDHRTTYRYERPATAVVQALRLSPRDHETQHVRSWRVDTDNDGTMRETADAFGNRLLMFYAEGPLDKLTLSVVGEVEVTDTAGVIHAPEPLPLAVFLRTTPLTAPDPALADLARLARRDDPLATLHAMMAAIVEQMAFEVAATDAATTAAAALAAGRGVCQDFAHIFCVAARLADIPARYVSGHLARPGVDVQDASHAWAEAHVPDLGWVAFDPANGICATDAYLRVAVGLDYLDAAPVRGARRGGGIEQMAVEVRAEVAQGQRQG
ncbi:MAG: transglutaminase family protein [Pseudomonadota bacterium]|jgi:transglutaminase-like putative cysteine protease|nr:transglutaminase family protein [Pseudomonadota bacterium]